MRRPTLALVTSIFLGFTLAACEGVEETDSRAQEAEFQFMGTSATCEREPRQPLTRPIHTLTVEDGEVVVEPDPLVQPPGPAGIIGWRSSTHDWRVTYTDGSPLPEDSYEGPGDGSLVFDFVRDDVECRAYAYEVEVWSDDGAAGDTLGKTYPAALADTVNGDEIEPYRFRR